MHAFKDNKKKTSDLKRFFYLTFNSIQLLFHRLLRRKLLESSKGHKTLKIKWNIVSHFQCICYNWLLTIICCMLEKNRLKCAFHWSLIWNRHRKRWICRKSIATLQKVTSLAYITFWLLIMKCGLMDYFAPHFILSKLVLMWLQVQ